MSTMNIQNAMYTIVIKLLNIQTMYTIVMQYLYIISVLDNKYLEPISTMAIQCPRLWWLPPSDVINRDIYKTLGYEVSRIYHIHLNSARIIVSHVS